MKEDLVPCYYTGQDYRVDEPAEVLPRFEVRRYKHLRLGKFVDSGKVFLFSARLTVQVVETICEFRMSARSVLTFLKASSPGDRLHYEIPMAGDVGLRRHNLFRRTNEAGISELRTRTIQVSARSGMRYLRAAAVPPTAPLASRLLAG